MPFTVPALLAALSERFPDRPALVHRATRLSFAELAQSANQVAGGLAGLGLGAVEPRAGLPGWVSGQDHVGLVLRNGPEYIEAMLGAFTQRAVPFNVNYRYTAQEMAEVFADARPLAVVVHDAFAEVVGEAVRRAGCPTAVIQVPDGSGRPLTTGALSWAEFTRGGPGAAHRTDWSPDDLYMLYTGGTTGRPKGVLWRQADIIVSGFAVLDRSGRPFASVAHLLTAVEARPRRRIVLPAPPFIHGAAQWIALGALLTGGQVVIQDDVTTLDPGSLFDVVEREGVTEVAIVGDAFGRPLAESLEARPRALRTLRTLLNGGAALSEGVRNRLLKALPHVRLHDGTGASETGRQATRRFDASGGTPELAPVDDRTVVVSEDRLRLLRPGNEEIGWLATGGRIPLGYLGDAAKTAETFLVIDGVRYSVPGDRARLLPDGNIVLLGRDSTMINTGGEKVFGEEVEAAILSHPAVCDAVVVGRPSERWGQEIVALVAVREPVDADDLLTHACRVLARYKLPKEVLFVAEVPRTPAGKADHRSARAIAADRSRAVPAP